jgi:prepilin-type N-terminal cleavage/methylation domain-containing protein/prepilin-type processing-associated H-X9-DG protein
MRGQGKGFTLIELLVVIAIIALLMSILMPALRNVRDQAKDSLCKQQLQQWGVMFNMYAVDNDGTLMDMSMYRGLEIDHAWIVMMQPYYKEFEICKCTSTIYTWADGENYFDPLIAWDYQILDSALAGDYYALMYKIGDRWPYGSYAKNTFVTNADIFRDGVAVDNLEHEWMYDFCYKNVRVRRTSTIPLLGDGTWMGGWPEPYEEPAETRWHEVDGLSPNIWNLDRHNLSINMVFLDWSVRKVGLRQLWSLRWSKEMVDQDGVSVSVWGNLNIVPDLNDPLQWPEWMRNSKNYDL